MCVYRRNILARYCYEIFLMEASPMSVESKKTKSKSGIIATLLSIYPKYRKYL